MFDDNELYNDYRRVSRNFDAKKIKMDSELIREFVEISLDKVRELISYRMNEKEKDEYGNNALMYACVAGRLDIVKKLIRNGANVNARNKSFNSVLMCACEAGHLGIVKELIANGAKITAKDMYAQTVWMYACKSGKLDVLKEVVDLKEDYARVVLFYICRIKRWDLVKELIDKRYYDVHSKLNIDDREFFEINCIAGNYLEEEFEGVDVNSKDINGKSLLMYVYEAGNWRMLKKLIFNGADINIPELDISVLIDKCKELEWDVEREFGIIDRILKREINKLIDNINTTYSEEMSNRCVTLEKTANLLGNINSLLNKLHIETSEDLLNKIKKKLYRIRELIVEGADISLIAMDALIEECENLKSDTYGVLKGKLRLLEIILRNRLELTTDERCSMPEDKKRKISAELSKELTSDEGCSMPENKKRKISAELSKEPISYEGCSMPENKKRKISVELLEKLERIDNLLKDLQGTQVGKNSSDEIKKIYSNRREDLSRQTVFYINACKCAVTEHKKQSRSLNIPKCDKRTNNVDKDIHK